MKRLIALGAYKSLVVLKKSLKYGHARKYFRSPGATTETIAFLTPFLSSLCSTNKRLSICDLVCSHNASRVICSLHTLRRRCTVPEKRASTKKKHRKRKKKRMWLPGTIINNRSSFGKDTFAFYYLACTMRFSLGSNRTWWIPRSTGNEESR